MLNDTIVEIRACVADIDSCVFDLPTAYRYNSLRYAWRNYEQYLRRYGSSGGPNKGHNAHLETMMDCKKQVVFMGMNPGPFGMMQTGIPFGDVDTVANWLRIDEEIDTPDQTHIKRPVLGLAYPRVEVSGKRLWGMFREKYTNPKDFFKGAFVLNYCPIAFLEESGRNRTPDKLPKSESKPLFELCDHLMVLHLRLFQPIHVVGVGKFARKCIERIVKAYQPEFDNMRICDVLHPSPASPMANRGWASQAITQLRDQNISW